MAISYDSVDDLHEFSTKRKIKFPLLSDKDSKVIREFGVLNDDASGRQAGIPHPGTFVVGPSGKVHATLLGSVRRRHSVEDLLKAVKKYDADAKK